MSWLITENTLLNAPRRVWHSIRNRTSTRRAPDYAADKSAPSLPDPEDKDDYRHPEVHAVNRNMCNPINLYRYITFAWINPMMNIGNRRPLQRSDLIDLPPEVIMCIHDCVWESPGVCLPLRGSLILFLIPVPVDACFLTRTESRRSACARS